MPSVSLAISTANTSDISGIIIEPSSPTSSLCPFSPMSMRHYSTEDLTSEDEPDLCSDASDNSPNLKFSFEDWHAPFNLHASCEIEYDEEDSQVLLIPSSSPFYQPPPTPQFNASFETQRESSDCSYPSICPTLSSKFDLLHSHSPLSSATTYNSIYGISGATQVSPAETVMIVDSSDDGLSNARDHIGIHVVKENVVDFKAIPDFPEDATLSSMHMF
ncbi:hypothetical protein D9756_005561 [Leucocoprinus leucothites]|uniref:Uncharacterized protein n=1 Tax=Leucocoprinus leucothites TaxID=201217 RepID=A0A8H5DA32_9AGAR|nr:hypothetical protein D9756_005561 [Leucoagaricus leucothites]